MRVVFLGAGGYHPNAHRHTACVMAPELGLVLDAGTGAFRIAQHLATDRLDVLLSHTHLDHVFGLTSLIGLFDGDDPTRLVVHGEAEKLAALERHLYAPLLFPVRPNFTLRPLVAGGIDGPGAGALRTPSACVRFFPLPGHPGGTLGFRVEDRDGKSFAYVTDTVAQRDAAYIDAIRGVDLLIHEAYFGDGEREMARLTGHSCVSDALAVAEAASVGRVVLVHMNPRIDSDQPLDLTAAERRFDELLVGRDGLRLTV